MKVILLQELKGRGGEGDVVEVKRGYAVNYLLPNKLATEATKGNLKQLELRKHNIAKREAERLDNADKIQAALTDRVLVIPARVGEEGQLFGSVTTQQIADKLSEELGLEVDRRKIDLHAPIKTAGEHSVTVSVYRDVKAVLTVDVVSDAEVAQEAEAAPAEAAEEATETEAADGTDEAIEAIVEDAEEALEAVADKLAADMDASDDAADDDAAADAAVEVLEEVEAVIDAAVEAAIEEAASDEQ